jgi:type VI secretion system protein ImpL
MAILQTIKNAARSPTTLIAIAAVAMAAVLAGLAWFGIFGMVMHSRWRWEIAIALVAGVAAVIVIWGIPWFRERRFVYRESSDYRVAGEASPQEFRAKFTHALRRFRSLPQQVGNGEPLYSLPWYLIMGPEGAGKTEAIKSTGLFSALIPLRTEGGTQNCDWWVSNTMVMLDTAGRYAFPAEITLDRAEWYRLLRLIRHYHGREPLNGIIVAVAANELASQPDEKLRANGDQIRERLEEAVHELGVEFPLYVLVTKCDLLAGFSEFFGVLPRRIVNEAVGFVDDPPAVSGGPARGTAAVQRFRASLHSIYERLHVLRLSVLNGNAPEALRQPIFCFPEEFGAIERPLGLFMESLLSEDVRYHTPLFRGVFFTSSRQEGRPLSLLRQRVHIAEKPAEIQNNVREHYFLHDIFDTILPRDRTLITVERRNMKPRNRTLQR